MPSILICLIVISIEHWKCFVKLIKGDYKISNTSKFVYSFEKKYLQYNRNVRNAILVRTESQAHAAIAYSTCMTFYPGNGYRHALEWLPAHHPWPVVGFKLCYLHFGSKRATQDATFEFSFCRAWSKLALSHQRSIFRTEIFSLVP